MNFSREELLFVSKNIKKGIRTDLRGLSEERKTEVLPIENSQSDGSLLIRRGHTKVSVSIQFKESEEGLLELKLIKEGERILLMEVERIPECIKDQIEAWLKGFKVGLRINLEVVNDDGNVYETFIYGLREVLKDVQVPDIQDLDKTIRSGISIPTMKVFCLFGDYALIDPLKIEEESCDSSFVIIQNGGLIKNMWTNKCGEINLEKVPFL